MTPGARCKVWMAMRLHGELLAVESKVQSRASCEVLLC